MARKQQTVMAGVRATIILDTPSTVVVLLPRLNLPKLQLPPNIVFRV